MKRIFDLLLGVAIFVFLLPFMLLIAFAVIFSSKGSALYWSDRVGKNNKIFKMPKFRSMLIETPDVATHLLSDPDTYLSPVGGFLRRSSLDELPQLFSVLKGDMSFVGPRPALFNQDDLIALRTDKGVDELLPGITGWAQVNGRDAIFFAHHQHSVVAIDQSTTAIDIEKRKLDIEIGQYLKLRALDFVKEDYSQYGKIDVFYSRFTIHSITKNDENLLLPNVYKSLSNDGLFCIEVRTTKDPLFGVGQSCGDNVYITDHKRRFIDSDDFLKNVLSLGFKLIYFTEKDNLSIYNNDNPVLMRMVLKK